MEYVLLAGAIAGVVELITRLRARDFWTAVTIFTAGLVGALFGYFGVDGVPSVVHGIVSGFSVSGLVSIVGSVGNKSSATTRTNIVK